MMLWSGTSLPRWKVHRYWVPSENVELNVWDRFENRFFDIYKGKKDAQKAICDFCLEGQSFHDLVYLAAENTKEQNLLQNQELNTAHEISKT
jgi:hypothetical protein